MIEIENGRIDSTMLGIEDHGILSYKIGINFAGYHQEFGGYSLDAPKKDDEGKFLERIGTDYGMESINRILKVLKVDTWEKLKGTSLRVKRKGSHNGPIIAIGHFMDDNWFEPERDLAEFLELSPDQLP